MLNSSNLTHSASDKAWQSIFFLHGGYSWYKELVSQNIIPRCNPPLEEINIWNLLASSESGREIFQILLAKGIIPTPNDLAQCWYLLASRESGRTIIKFLLNKGIYPSAYDLAVCYKVDGVNTWYCLASTDSGREIFQMLSEKGILPTPQDLSHYHNNNLDNTWLVLAKTPRGREIFITLLLNNIIPLYKNLEYARPNEYDEWHWVESNIWESLKQSDLLLEMLSRFDILPNKKLTGKNPIIKAINNRLDRLNQLSQSLSLKNEQDLAVVLTSTLGKDCYGFLIWTLSEPTHNFPQLPLEVYYLIGSYLLPKCINPANLLSLENKVALIKYCIVAKLDIYLDKSFIRHEERANSFKQAILTCDRDSIAEILYLQLRMSSYPGYTPYPNPTKKHEAAYDRIEENFKKILVEGEFLSRNLRLANK